MDDFPQSPQRRESETDTRGEQIQSVKLLASNTFVSLWEKTDTMIK